MPKKEILPVEILPDPDAMQPQTSAEYAQRGWLYFSHQKLGQAQEDLERSISLENSIDTFYALGLVYRAQGEFQKALECFDHVLAHLGEVADPQRATMLRRLVLGQINFIKTGDWNLEKEVWKRIR